MSKLTAERARERITHLKRWQEQRGLTLREEEYLEALQLAAAVLCELDRKEVWLKCREMCYSKEVTFPVDAAREGYELAFKEIKKAAEHAKDQG